MGIKKVPQTQGNSADVASFQFRNSSLSSLPGLSPHIALACYIKSFFMNVRYVCGYMHQAERKRHKTWSNIQSLPSGHDEGSLHCSTQPALSLHVEQESVLCGERRWLVHSSHVTADCSPLCGETVIEASIWYRSDVAFTTAFRQYRGTQTTPASAVRHQRALLCQALHYFYYTQGEPFCLRFNRKTVQSLLQHKTPIIPPKRSCQVTERRFVFAHGSILLTKKVMQ